jgi:hypothetical protein
MIHGGGDVGAHYSMMILISILSGTAAAMYVWADKFSDVRFSLNDAYMVALMTSVMILIMALADGHALWTLAALVGIIGSLWLIRTQRYVTKKHYFRGMIPHHSMAVMMSRRLLAQDVDTATDPLTHNEREFVKQIIAIQEKEIAWMKQRM